MSKPTSRNRHKAPHQRGAKCKSHCKPQKDERVKDSGSIATRAQKRGAVAIEEAAPLLCPHCDGEMPILDEPILSSGGYEYCSRRCADEASFIDDMEEGMFETAEMDGCGA